MTGAEETINQLGALSYGGIWVVSFLSNIVIPIPEEIVLLALGYLSGTGVINGYIVIPIIISALLLNDLILYLLSKHGSKLTSFLYTKFFAKRLEKKGNFVSNISTKKIVFFSRFLMQLRFLGPFLAGTRNFPKKDFVRYNFFALLIYVPLYVGLGWYFHSRVLLIIKDVSIAKNIFLMVLSGVIIFAIIKTSYRWVFKKMRVDLN